MRDEEESQFGDFQVHDLHERKEFGHIRTQLCCCTSLVFSTLVKVPTYDSFVSLQSGSACTTLMLMPRCAQVLNKRYLVLNMLGVRVPPMQCASAMLLVQVFS